MDISGMRVLVTGGSGVIGRELLALLQEAGASILTVDRVALPAEVKRTGIQEYQADLAFADLAPIAAFDPQAVFHLAASFERSIELPGFWEPNWGDNVTATHRVAHVLSGLSHVQVCVFASSYLIYSPSLYLLDSPRDQAIGLCETEAISTRNLCGAAKLYGESEFDFVGRQLAQGMRTVHARIFRVYGCGSRDIISRWVRAALSGETLQVHNRENRFDYIYAGDVAAGLLRLATVDTASGVVNLGTGRARTISEVLSVLAEQIPGAETRIQELESQAPYEASAADTTRLQEVLDWLPPRDIEAGIRSIVAYEKARQAGGPN